MSNHFPISSPPPELVTDLWAIYHRASIYNVRSAWTASVNAAYRAGADQELEACVNYVDNTISGNKARALRAIRRPKPPSLKEQALAELEKVDTLWDTSEFGADTLSALDTIRRAIEQLPDAL